jgi:hypothetical protein
MDTQPKIPTLKDSQKPQVKVRGLESGVTLFDRLKQFKKKDLAFILAGLGTLFMAPLAEHFMMSPETGDGTLQPGWHSGAGGKGMFDGSGSSPYEPGTTGLAPGGAVGGGSDIITPLNVRDPSALVMGPGATQQPPTNSVMPATPPPTAPATHSDSDLKDALAASARGVGAAAHAAKSLLPVPKISLAGGGSLRGLGVANGGSSASAGGISSAGLAPSRGTQGSNLGGIRGGNNIKGVARGSSPDGASALDALKKAGDAAAGNFGASRSGSADLVNAASQAMPTGNASGGNGAGGAAPLDKADSGNSIKDGKNVGESLAFLKQKAMQEAQIALWSKEQEAGDNKLEALKIRNSMAEAVAGSIGTAIGNFVTCPLTAGSSLATCMGSAGPTICTTTDGTKSTGYAQYSASSIVPQSSCAGGNPTSKTSQSYTYAVMGNGGLMNCQTGQLVPNTINCQGAAAAGAATTTPPPGSVGGMNGVAGDLVQSPAKNLGDDCKILSDIATKLGTAGASTAAQITAFNRAAAKVVAARDAMQNSANSATYPSSECGATPLSLTGGAPVITQLQNIASSASGSLTTPQKGLLDTMDAMTTSVTSPDPGQATAGAAYNKGDGSPENTKGIDTAITNLQSDVNKLLPAKGLLAGLTVTLPTAAALGATTGGGAGFSADQIAKITAALPQALKEMKDAGVNVDSTIDHLNTAAGLLTAQNPNIRSVVGDASGKGGSLDNVIADNKALDQIMGAPGMAQLPAGVTKPDAWPPKPAQPAPGGGSAAAVQPSVLTDDHKAAAQAITDAHTAMTATPLDATAANTKLTAAVTAVQKSITDQAAVDASIRTDAKKAGTLLGL